MVINFCFFSSKYEIIKHLFFIVIVPNFYGVLTISSGVSAANQCRTLIWYMAKVRGQKNTLLLTGAIWLTRNDFVFNRKHFCTYC
jgi:hypothetical protein